MSKKSTTKQGRDKTVKVQVIAKSKTEKAATSKPRKLAAAHGVEKRKAALAKKLGIQDVGAVSLDIAKMRDLGLLVDIGVYGLTSLTAQTTWNELGIPEGDVRRERLKRGSKDLIPSEYIRKLRSIETRFRASLKGHSFPLEGFRPYRWVPFTAYEDWKKEWKELQAEWNEVKEEIISHYDEFIEAGVRDFGQIAREAWDSIMARYHTRSGDDLAAVLIIGSQTFESAEDFVAYIVERANKLPTKKELEANLYVDYRTALVLSGADVAAEQLQQEKLYTRAAAERGKQNTVRAQAQTAQEAEWAKQRELSAQASESEQKATLRVAAEQKRLQAMHEAEMQHARDQLSQIISPFRDVFEQLRGRIYQDVTEIAASIKKNGHLRGKVAERARNLLDTFQLLNAHGDNELATALQELRSRLPETGTTEGARYDTRAVLAQLDAISDMTHEAALDVTQRLAATTRSGALEM
jgi:hypothetical protein